MSVLFQDLRFAVRVLLSRPGFVLVVILTLALGIGANTAIFSMVNGLLLRPMPIHEAASVVQVFGEFESGGLSSTHSYPSFVDQREQCDVFTDLCMRAPSPAHFDAGDGAMRVEAAMVSGSFFSMLGVEPAVGRLLTAADDAELGGNPVVVVSFDMWKRVLHGDPAIVGREIRLNNFPFIVAGVTSRGFTGVTMRPTDVWAPAAMHDAMRPDRAGEELHPFVDRGTTWLRIYGRLKPEVTIEQAEARTRIVYGRLREADPIMQPPGARLLPVSDTRMGLRTRAATVDSMMLLMITVGVVLLIACANVAGLLMARMQDRQHEFAIRQAMGAGRARIVRQLLTESVLLALLGGAIGLLLSVWLNDLMQVLIPESRLLSNDAVEISVDRRVLMFTLAVAVITGLLFGLAPALRSARVDFVSTIKAGSRTTLGPGQRRSLQQGLVVGQVALSFVLLIVAGLFLRTLMKVQTTNPGFDPENVLLASVETIGGDWDEQRILRFQDRLRDRSQLLPGVVSVGMAGRIPMHSQYQATMELQGHEPVGDSPPRIHFNTVSPGYFATMRIPVLAGRTFAHEDAANAPLVAVVNETMAAQFWDGDALGKSVRIWDRSFEVAGVVGDGKYHGIRETPRPFIYFPLSERCEEQVTLAVRTTGSPRAVSPLLKAALSDIEPTIPLYNVRTLQEHLGSGMAQERMAAWLLCILGVVAIGLVAAGLYGVMSFAVARRIREIGVRMALGARRRDVMCLILGRGLLLVAVGCAIGLFGALVLTRLLHSRLYDVTPTDPVTFVGVFILLAFVGALACYIPARRATKVDPMIALRYE